MHGFVFVFRLLLSLLLIAGINGCIASSDVRLPGSAGSLPRTYFGMHIHRADTTTPWPVARFGAFRMWDAAVSWEKLEPVPGHWQFERLDKLVSLALSNGVEPLLTLGITPRWAASRPDQPFVYGNGGNSPPREMQDWENYVRTVAIRYKGRIKYYELWNEPTFDEIDKGKGFYAGSARTMVELGRVAYRVIKEIDPNNKLLSPGFTDEGARLDLYLTLGGGDITDIVAHHFYAEQPEFIAGRVEHIRAVMAKHGIADRPLWNTESGYDIPASGGALTAKGPHTDTELGGYIARALVIGAASGLDRFYWYSWERTMLSRWRRDAMVNPAIVAYTQTLRWLNGATVNECTSKDRRQWICELGMGSRKAWMVWNTKETTQWAPPAEWHALQYETLDARLVRLGSGDSVQVGPAPVLVKSDADLWSVSQGSP